MGKGGWKKRLAAGVVAAIFAGGSVFAWRQLKPAGLPDSFAVGNGRIEATEIDIATKAAGRITEILVHDGDVVEAGQILARMDTQTLEAELRQAQAQVRQAQQAKATAIAIVAQRESAKATASAVIAQRESELALAEKELTRSQQLAFKGAGSQQQLDTDYTRYKSTTAALSAAQSQLVETQSAIAAAKSQVAEAQSALAVAKSQVVEAQSAIEAALATTERLKVEIEDSSLKAPRSGRVQYRVAQPGEVLPAGGKILTILDLSDVYMTFFLPETLAGRVAIGAETRVVLDAAPHYVFPATVERRPGPNGGTAAVLREETGRCTTRAAGVEVHARRERCAETTSGRSSSQQGLTATCTDLVLRVQPRHEEGGGLAHEPVGARKVGEGPRTWWRDIMTCTVTPCTCKGALGTWQLQEYPDMEGR